MKLKPCHVSYVPPKKLADGSVIHHALVIEPYGFALSRVGGVTEEDRQVAEAIVRAANFHDDLVAAGTKAIGPKRHSNTCRCLDCEVQDILRAVVAEATQSTKRSQNENA